MFCDNIELLNWPLFSQSIVFEILIWGLLRAEEAEEEGSDEVLTGRDNGERRTSSFHSSISLDVTLHLFISSLTCSSKMRVDEWRGEEGGPRTWSWAYQVSPNIEPISKVVHIWIIVCRVEWINERMSSFWIVCQRVASVYCVLSVGRSNVTMLERHYVCGVSPRNPRTLCSFPIIITAFSFSTAIIYNLIVPVHKISRCIK